jgi:hypothetical protein
MKSIIEYDGKHCKSDCGLLNKDTGKCELPNLSNSKLIFDKQEQKYLRNRKCLKLTGDL